MKVTYANAIGDALKEEMRRDGKVLIYGEDIAQFGNIFGITRGMLEEFGPKRVRNTPLRKPPSSAAPSARQRPVCGPVWS